MNTQDITQYLKDKSQSLDAIGAKLKLVIDGDPILIDGTGEKNIISNEDLEADCVVTTSVETLQSLKDGSLNPMMAMMKGALKIKGNMMLASKLEKLMK